MIYKTGMREHCELCELTFTVCICLVTRMRIRLICTPVFNLFLILITLHLHTLKQSSQSSQSTHSKPGDSNQKKSVSVAKQVKQPHYLCTLCISVNLYEGETRFCLVRLQAGVCKPKAAW